ncbi:MAG TPA: biotin carboxylase N-terminal domain-containing protein, partial [Planctomycetota bacterium]|nr:biotin carboxylase N-terminal domain-containing protein [Planctomycetota bacterium]
PHVRLASEAVDLGGPEGYLDLEGVIAAARRTGSTAIHPGYGFLSQNAAFARRCAQEGIVFIGPSPEAMEALGDKRGSRKTAEGLGIPVVPGVRDVDSLEEARAGAQRVGYPVLLKAAGGGGGKGMRLVSGPGELEAAHEAARREAVSAFGDGRLILEKYISPARHVEVQILGDGSQAVSLGERECSLQRRYQKVIEESPSPGIGPKTREGLVASALALARAVGYRNAGTVEFLVAPDGSHAFLEVNTRLQVEHPVTEMLTGLDVVRAQIEIVQGRPLPAVPSPRGHAIEARLYAEDAHHGYLPETGRLESLRWPQIPWLRIDSGLLEGMEITPHYDPLLAKVIAWGAGREEARVRLLEALGEIQIRGIGTNRAFLRQVLESEAFRKGETYTTTLETATWPEPEEEALAGAVRAAPRERSGDPYSPWSGMGPARPGDRRRAARRSRSAHRGTNSREIRAPMTGRIVKVLAAPGLGVRANDVVVIMEAMKMEYRLSAPREGEVATVHCKGGDWVDLDQVLVTLKP